MTVGLVDNKQDKPNSQIWRWDWLTTNKTNQTRWLMTSEFGSSWWGIKRVWLITSEFVCLDRITSSSVSCWEQQSLTRKIVMDWLMWKMLQRGSYLCFQFQRVSEFSWCVLWCICWTTDIAEFRFQRLHFKTMGIVNTPAVATDPSLFLNLICQLL